MILALFFTRGVSLEVWLKKGLFDREKLIYEEHLKQGNFKKIYWFTYGSNDNDLAKQLKEENRLHKDIEVFEMPNFFKIPKIGNYLYSILLPIIYKKKLIESDILKTNQMDGSWSAVIAKILYKKKLFLRTGYTLTQLETIINKKRYLKNLFNTLIERIAYSYADISSVASKHNLDYVNERYSLKSKIEIIPNFVDISLFKPIPLEKYPKNRILFVGRLSKAKNLFNLIKAVSRTDFVLDIYGDGELKSELIAYSKKYTNINFKGTVANSELPLIMNRYHFYILPSFQEGMPKTLIEAMACGVVCLGTNVNGINEIIEDKVTGYLAQTTNCEDIINLLEQIKIKDEDELLNVRKNAIQKIKDNYTLESIIKKELTIFNTIIGNI